MVTEQSKSSGDRSFHPQSDLVATTSLVFHPSYLFVDPLTWTLRVTVGGVRT